MPSEIRELRFSLPEILQALKAYLRRVGTPLPPGSLVRCGPECDAAGAVLRFRITMVPDGGRRGRGSGTPKPAQDVVVESANLAAALILFCRELRIPLAAQATKVLRGSGEHVSLIASLNRKQHSSTAAADAAA